MKTSITITENNISSIVPIGNTEVWDITLGENNMFRGEPNFIANGILLHNCHASGVVLSDIPLEEIAPLRRTKEDSEGNVEYATQFAYEDLELLGLIKFDILAISTLTVISECVKMIKANLGIDVDIENLPLDPAKSIEAKKTYDLYKSGKLVGVFQCESLGMQETCVEVGVDRFEDIMAVISLYRPGPMDSIPDYCARKKGEQPISYFHPTIEPYVKPILESTYGVLVFQEQIMLICNSLANMSLTDGYGLIKGIGKKKKELIEKYKKIFIAGCSHNGVPIPVAEQYWENFIIPFASYGFNACLSGDTTVINKVNGEKISLEKLCVDFSKTEASIVNDPNRPKVILDSVKNGIVTQDTVLDVFETGEKEVYEIVLSDGSTIKSTLDHKFLCCDGTFHTIREIKEGDLEIIGNI